MSVLVLLVVTILLLTTSCESYHTARIISSFTRLVGKATRLKLSFDDLKAETEKKMTLSLHHLQEVLSTIRSNGPSVNILDRVFVEHLGTRSRVPDICRITSPNNLLLVLEPFQHSTTLAKDIEKSLIHAKINLNVQQDSNGNIVIQLPPPTEERRKDFVKQAHHLCEEGRVSIRNVRRESIEKIKIAERDKEISKDQSLTFQDKLQKVTDEFNKQIDNVMETKEKELMNF